MFYPTYKLPTWTVYELMYAMRLYYYFEIYI